ncbi:ISAzo13-like element transposase-related protein [Mycobacterium riyadhense]|uniref:ISAzo13-like element transposase-related protein n=1 Tax=Mycobacterium riyadhense TaxID=486698 RepID=UPI001EF9CFE5|nr:hypothetical protein [Mycobacterium riyadhense]
MIKSTRQLSTALTGQGHRCSDWLVRRCCTTPGRPAGRGQADRGHRHPHRHAQFCYVNDQVRAHHWAGQPVIGADTNGVDINNKELVGHYTNGATQWRPSGNPEKVKTRDVPDKDLGKAIP